ncbi:hypothetical protein CAPTEDRAFT_97415 [Capitella teleta]|uniref:Glycosyltransferase 2-like domain-containing protein n=1 Tax=Capitella teleta TaxID=283909 RepID=R7TC53_CAPTE|nr:hypothetical protein CAPTEDRAFT_97415 [Capitella teleta]|eukprot:ELT91284.1 hypothetical protein CAPTEDRAFT_97415 [Capitella teleta]
MTVDISIILPVYNAEKWLPACLASIRDQLVEGFSVEISTFNDGSTDASASILQDWRPVLEAKGFMVTLSNGEEGQPKGVGAAKNAAISRSQGRYLCFQDADDEMRPTRLALQYTAAKKHPTAIIGAQFSREPPGSTERYTNWANRLSPAQLHSQSYTSHGPTVIMPSWFMSRQTYDSVEGGFDETGKGTPEDLIFFYKHLSAGGRIHRVDEELIVYRYHPDAETFSVLEKTIWDLRMEAIAHEVLSTWNQFSIWNAGKQGRKFFRSLSVENQRKVKCFCDVDPKKINKKFYVYEETDEMPKPRIPIIHFTQVKPPLILCVKQDLTSGGFEKNLKSMNFQEGQDYFHFN